MHPISASYSRLCDDLSTIPDPSLLRGLEKDSLSTIRSLSSFGRQYDSYLSTGYNKPTSPYQFLTDMLTVDEWNHPALVKSIRQLSLFFSKADLPTEKQDDEIWGDFKRGQQMLACVKVPVYHPVIKEAKKWLEGHLSALDLTNITPSHGPGAVKDGSDRIARYKLDSWLSAANRVYPFCSYGRTDMDPAPPPSLLSQSSTRVVIVPKDYRGGRLISVEPHFNMWLQQGQMRQMYRYLRRYPFWRYTRLERQEYNHSLLRSLEYATVDLSNASDTVSASLVWHLWPRNSRAHLFRTRSAYADFKGDRQKLYCFAPMGSAVCFPVETIIFLSLVIGAWKVCFPRRPLFELTARVYGDDIIVPQTILPTLLDALVECGCTPNPLKTCSRTPFRESCGLDMYDGHDVSVMRLKYLPSQNGRVNHLRLVDLNQQAFAWKFTSLASYFREWARRYFPYPTCSYVNGEGFLAAHVPDYSGCRTRWNPNYQRLEVATLSSMRMRGGWTTESPNRLLARLVGDSIVNVTTLGRKPHMVWRPAADYC